MSCCRSQNATLQPRMPIGTLLHGLLQGGNGGLLTTATVTEGWQNTWSAVFSLHSVSHALRVNGFTCV